MYRPLVYKAVQVYNEIHTYVERIILPYHEQQNKWYLPSKGVYLPISKLHSIFAVANLLAHADIANHKLLCASKFTAAKVECRFEMDKKIPLGVQFI